MQNNERKSHRLVDLDIVLAHNDKTVLAHVLRIAVYKMRHLGGRDVQVAAPPPLVIARY